ncbi:MAG: tripartite tricarboxylate transporter permease, partial [Haliea sp.]
TPEQFGKGSPEGIVASEAANNATVGGALIPLITLGIPGSLIDAILLGALVLHNFQPGPLLFQTQPDLVYGIMGTALIANIAMFIIMCLAASWISKLVQVPAPVLIPIILLFCVIGTFALHNRVFDIWVMLGFGVVGFLFDRLKIPVAPFIIGLVLAPIAEGSLRSGLMSSAGSIEPFFTRPMSLVFLLLAIGLLVWPFIQQLWRARSAG